MDDDATALQQIDEALRQRGFKRDWTVSRARMWRGDFQIVDKTYPISITIGDLDFVDLPDIVVEDAAALPIRPLTHIFTGNGICYFNRTTAVLDRYDPAGTVLRCLKQANEVLSDSLAGTTDKDFAVEFSSYWKGTVLVDLPANYSGKTARIYWLALHPETPETTTGVIAQKDGLAGALLLRHRKVWGRKKPSSDPCVFLTIDKPLTVVPGAWPPRDFVGFAEWLKHFTSDPLAILRSVLALEARKVLMLKAPNGYFLAEIEVPPAYRKPEFVQHRHSLRRIATAIATKLSVQRYAGYRIDADFVFGRNMQGMKNLVGKKLAVIGCGTIGGFLAHALAESGAGALGGQLHLFDRDILKTSNLGRHILGVPHLGKPKCEAMRSFLTEQLPHVTVRDHVGNVLDWKEQLLTFDLVIDATGEEALSLALNHFLISKRPAAPPILFIYLVGNGVVAQALMAHEPQLACLKCLKPELAELPRYPLLREDASIVTSLPCDEGSYVPFPVSRSMQAAALAVEMALDWVNDRPRPYLRTRTFDERKAFHVKDQNPEISERCPEHHGV